MGILPFPASSTRHFKNSNNISTHSTLVPKFSIIPGTTSFQSGIWKAKSERARHNWVTIAREPVGEVGEEKVVRD
jgi:hypothetical protein